MALQRIDTPTIHFRHDRGARPRSARAVRAGIALAALVSLALSAGPGQAGASDATVAQLIARDLIGVPGKEVTMETVEYPPGGKSPPHRHHAQVFVYVLQGSLRMQVQGSPAETLGPGGTFYESPDDVHTVSENASQTKPAKFLVVMVKDKAPGVGANVDESGQSRAQAAGRPLLALPGPDLVLKTIDGKTIDLAKLCGRKPVYLKFWATWCVPCREQMPGFEHDYETLGDRIAFIAVNAGFNDTESAVRQVCAGPDCGQARPRGSRARSSVARTRVKEASLVIREPCSAIAIRSNNSWRFRGTPNCAGLEALGNRAIMRSHNKDFGCSAGDPR
jgi:quercetin dioxygenase-like cupin family protein